MSPVVFTPSPTTRRARELAKELTATVEAFVEREPRTRPGEIDRAFRLARSRLGSENRALLLGALAALLLIAGLGLFLMTNR